MALTTLLGTAQLQILDALSRALDRNGGVSRIPNHITISFRRHAFLAEIGEDTRDNRERIRREIETAIRRYVTAHGWSIGGNGTLAIDVLPRSIPQDCDVRVSIIHEFCRLTILDDAGSRDVGMASNPTIIGRAHAIVPGGFIPLADALRLISGEHLELRYTDLEIHASLLGRNPTTLNDSPMTVGQSVVLSKGDVIRCGACEVCMLG